MEKETNDKHILTCLLCTFFVSGAAAQPLGSLIPFFRQAYGLNYELTGVLLSLQSVGNMSTILIMGFLPLWLGRRRSILFMAAWMALAYMIFFTGIGGAAGVSIAFLATGFARGANGNFSNTVVSSLKNSKSAYSLLHFSFAFGALISPLVLMLLNTLFDENGWRIMVALLCLLCIAQLILYHHMPLPPEPRRTERRRPDFSFLRKKRFWLCAMVLFLYISAEYATTGWLVTYLQDSGRLGSNGSQLMISLYWLMMCAARLTGSKIISRVERWKILLVDGIVFFFSFVFMLLVRSPLATAAGIMLLGGSMATIYTVTFSYGSDVIAGNDLGCSFLTFSGGLGGVITPALVGVVAEGWGITAGMTVVVAVVACLLAAIVVMTGIVRKQSGSVING